MRSKNVLCALFAILLVIHTLCIDFACSQQDSSDQYVVSTLAPDSRTLSMDSVYSALSFAYHRPSGDIFFSYGLTNSIQRMNITSHRVYPIIIGIKSEGMVFDSTYSTLYVSNTPSHCIYRFSNLSVQQTTSGTSIFAGNSGQQGNVYNVSRMQARFNLPSGLILDPEYDDNNYLLVADYGNNAIKNISLITGYVTQVLGDDVNVAGPYAFAWSPLGELFFTQAIGRSVSKLFSAEGSAFFLVMNVINHSGTYGDVDGPAEVALLKEPRGLAFDYCGDLWIADAGSHKIKQYNATTEEVFTVAGNGTAGYSPTPPYAFNNPISIFIAKGEVFVGDVGNNLIRTIGYGAAHHHDNDGDGFYAPHCLLAPHEADCDDNNSSVYPSAYEECDQLDNDCNGIIDDNPAIRYVDLFADNDLDGRGSMDSGAVDSMKALFCEEVHPLEGFSIYNDDCNDHSSSVSPVHEEVCDGIDNNCNDLIDEGLDVRRWYRDRDNDGYGASNDSFSSCEAHVDGYVLVPGDCDDGDASANPGAIIEICGDFTDNDCDGIIDEKCDHDDDDDDGGANIPGEGEEGTSSPFPSMHRYPSSTDSEEKYGSSSVSTDQARNNTLETVLLVSAGVGLVVAIIFTACVIVGLACVILIAISAHFTRAEASAFGFTGDEEDTHAPTDHIDNDNNSRTSREISSESMEEPQEAEAAAAAEEEYELNELEKDFSLVSLDDVHIDARIGQGAYGVVFKAMLHGNVVAMKRFTAIATTNDAQTIARIQEEFNHELNMLASLKHEHIVRLHAAVIAYPDLCIITEYCDVGSLYGLLYGFDGRASERRSSEHLTWAQKISILRDIALGLEYIHSKRIIHRDIKSQNILLSSRRCDGDDKGRVSPCVYVGKIADLGLAKLKSASTETEHLSEVNTHQVGTSLWMAPEVTLGEKYNTSADVFSFGIIMFEVLTETLPYQEEPRRDNLHLRVAMDPTLRPRYQAYKAAAAADRRQHYVSVRAAYIDLMTRCWQHDPAQRPTMSQVVKLLAKLDMA